MKNVTKTRELYTFWCGYSNAVILELSESSEYRKSCGWRYLVSISVSGSCWIFEDRYKEKLETLVRPNHAYFYGTGFYFDTDANIEELFKSIGISLTKSRA